MVTSSSLLLGNAVEVVGGVRGSGEPWRTLALARRREKELVRERRWTVRQPSVSEGKGRGSVVETKM